MKVKLSVREFDSSKNFQSKFTLIEEQLLKQSCFEHAFAFSRFFTTFVSIPE